MIWGKTSLKIYNIVINVKHIGKKDGTIMIKDIK